MRSSSFRPFVFYFSRCICLHFALLIFLGIKLRAQLCRLASLRVHDLKPEWYAEIFVLPVRYHNIGYLSHAISAFPRLQIFATNISINQFYQRTFLSIALLRNDNRNKKKEIEKSSFKDERDTFLRKNILKVKGEGTSTLLLSSFPRSAVTIQFHFRVELKVVEFY